MEIGCVWHSSLHWAFILLFLVYDHWSVSSFRWGDVQLFIYLVFKVKAKDNSLLRHETSSEDQTDTLKRPPFLYFVCQNAKGPT